MPSLPLAEVVADFLADARGRLKPSTVALYAADLDILSATAGTQPLDAISPALLTKWLAGMRRCGPTTKGMRLRSASAFFGWAVRMGYCPDNPAKKVDRPKERSRGAEAVISDADREKLLAKASTALTRVLIVLHGTGCRPGEAAKMTAADVRDGIVVLSDHKSDGTGRPRLIVPSKEVVALLRDLAAVTPTGPLLRTERGNPWTGRSITKAVVRLRGLAGVSATAYGFRHTFATDALARGIPDATVAALLGHSSTAMLHKHYSHLTSRPDVLKQAVDQVRKEEPPPPPPPEEVG
ncbi:tyrosine-type recombinase/integrase [Limnoglobus roseus]|nr:tyrosine-type recombinase/integrase [Limnoglobus roseus]